RIGRCTRPARRFTDFVHPTPAFLRSSAVTVHTIDWKPMRTLTYCAALAVLSTASALASSHREAPLITHTPKLDATDFYIFRSYEPGRSNYVTIVANYLPLQYAYGGPNYFQLDANAVYEVHIDNT